MSRIRRTLVILSSGSGLARAASWSFQDAAHVWL
jgi:hypothetical protein